MSRCDCLGEEQHEDYCAERTEPCADCGAPGMYHPFYDDIAGFLTVCEKWRAALPPYPDVCEIDYLGWWIKAGLPLAA